MIEAAVVERLRDKARGYELSALAAKDRGDIGAAHAFAEISLVLFELAEVFELEAAA